MNKANKGSFSFLLNCKPDIICSPKKIGISTFWTFRQESELVFSPISFVNLSHKEVETYGGQ